MFKKIIFGVLFVGLITALVIGAVNRTMEKSGDTAEAAGRGQGTGRASLQNVNVSHNQTNAVQGQGNGFRGGQQAAGSERAYPNYQEAPADWLTYEGTVVQVPAAGVDLVLATGEGEIVVGVGPLDLAESGLALQAGDLLQVTGYWEGEEFKAAGLSHPASGQSITLRDELGRPAWSGAGRNSRQDAIVGNGNAGNSPGGGGRGGSNPAAGQAGEGQAEVDAWLNFQGTVTSVDENLLLVTLESGEQVSVENRAWWFAQEQGFAAGAGQQVSLRGFYEDATFEVGQIDNLSTGQTVQIRQETGRPLWAGGGRWG